MSRTDPDPSRAKDPPARGIGRLARRLCLIMIIAVVLGGAGFIYKLSQFAKEAVDNDLFSFAFVPILIYVLVAVGFACLFAWALMRGQFKDIEAPKYRMLEQEEEYERTGV